ncbi:hypothetical protein PVL29_019506 [Vitis rotundifolia]|uniref:Uncharacterized protein n=1 Tax=Vitis rotundifolia TaxID=103349 RepID=A0AA38Z0P8_VITRO|nr:hypothetical protein PVL29_019506 [Vitis rotundifolia]
MASNLRIGFRERQRKRLSKSIVVNPTPSKKACPKLASIPPPMLVPSTITVIVTPESDEKPPSADDISYHEMRRPFCMTSSPPRPKLANVPNQEEISKLLKCIPSFTKRESPVQNMRLLFPATYKFFTAWLPYDIPDTDIAHILHMQDYTTFEIAEMVCHLSSFHLFLP